MLTTPRAQVSVTLDVTAVTSHTVRKGHKNVTVKKTVVLYRASIRGAANAYGGYTGTLHLKYVVKAPVASNVRVSAQSGAASVAANTPVQLVP